jgi:tetratricopeptide (TPR) repeat protein
MLWARPDDPPLLRNAAAAAAHFDFDQVELRYLQAAREKAPDDVETMRALGQSLARQGRFEDAIGPWCAVLALQPGDKEGQQAMDDLRGVHQASQEIATPDHDADALLERARRSQDAGDFAAAEACLAKAQSALGGDLSVLAMREDLRIRHAEQRVQIARRRAVSDQHPKAQRLVQRLADEQTRLEIEILNARAERLPGDAGIRIDLARRLKQAGNFSGAVQRLEEALRLKPDEPAALVELGECWQHLRQFAKALELYERATANAQNSAEAMGKLAHYRAGVLAAVLGQTDAARDHFRLVHAADPGYKDAGERLDKLGPN